MIPIRSGVRVWIATGHTDMRRGMQSLALTVQESLKRNPHTDDLYIFRGHGGDLVKILWHVGLVVSLYATRLDRGKFVWPALGIGRRSVDLSGTDGQYAGRNRLADSATDLAAAERGLSRENQTNLYPSSWSIVNGRPNHLAFPSRTTPPPPWGAIRRSSKQQRSTPSRRLEDPGSSTANHRRLRFFTRDQSRNRPTCQRRLQAYATL